ncbi:MAG: sigma-70 family RNA polymerase sigma factor, partial [Pseudomonadota bacterium]
RILGEAIAELPERTRIAFHMYRIEGKSLKEIARYLDVSQVRVHQLVKDAIRHGAKRLDREA